MNRLRATLTDPAPPGDATPAVEALWWAGRGDWDRAHLIVQSHEGDTLCDRVHAMLHRQEGDHGNAGYWYRRAGVAPASGPFELEWDAIAAAVR